MTAAIDCETEVATIGVGTCHMTASSHRPPARPSKTLPTAATVQRRGRTRPGGCLRGIAGLTCQGLHD